MSEKKSPKKESTIKRVEQTISVKITTDINESDKTSTFKVDVNSEVGFSETVSYLEVAKQIIVNKNIKF